MIEGYHVRDLEMLQDEVGAWYYRFNGIPYTGFAYSMFPSNGNISGEYNFLKGYQEGIQKIWYPNGQLKTKYGMKNNIYHGKGKSWYESGILSYEGEYDMGKLIWSKSYNEKGELIKQFP